MPSDPTHIHHQHPHQRGTCVKISEPTLTHCTCILSCLSCPTLCALWTVAHQSLLSMGFSRPEYWSWLQCPSPEDLPGPGIKPSSFTSPALVGEFFTTSATWYIIITQNPSFIVGFTLDVIHSGGLDNYIMTFIQHYCIIQSSFTAIKILCAPPIHSPPLHHKAHGLQTWQPSIVLSSLECHVVEIIQHVASSASLTWLNAFKFSPCVS